MLHYSYFITPLLCVLMFVDAILLKKKTKIPLQLESYVYNACHYILTLLTSYSMKISILVLYFFVQQNYSLFSVSSSSILSWVLLYLSLDFLGYWNHRATHRNMFLWFGHEIHHQGEQFNISLAFRHGVLESISMVFFYLPCAFIGVPLGMMAVTLSLIMIYDACMHTEQFSKPGLFGHVFITPSTHRVHHGINMEYLDKNYGITLIIWDKLFGTYMQEVSPPIYGTLSPLVSQNPFYNNINTIKNVLFFNLHTHGVWRKLLIFIKPPEYFQSNALSLTMPKNHAGSMSFNHVLYAMLNLGIIFVLDYNYFGYWISNSIFYLNIVFILLTLYLLTLLIEKTVLNWKTTFLVWGAECLKASLLVGIIFNQFTQVDHVLGLVCAITFFLINQQLFSWKSTATSMLNKSC